MLLRGQVTDKGIIALSESCQSLSSINLCDCNQVTDKGVIALAESCKSLSSIQLSFCNQVSQKLKDSLRTRGIKVNG